jgi:hypothetical protein
VSDALYQNITARKSRLNTTSTTSVSAEEVMNCRTFSSSRTLATV